MAFGSTVSLPDGEGSTVEDDSKPVALGRRCQRSRHRTPELA
ncbi:hypothetical protein [Oxynema aestuarii]|nr:hypothetical protein [Oxynema aestuarii]